MNKNKEGARQVDAGAALGGLTALARDKLPPPFVDGESGEAYARFRYEVATRASRGRSAVRWAWAPAAAAAVFAVVVLVRHVGPPQPISVRVEGGAVDEGGYIRAVAEGAPSLRFSDGSLVELARASRVRVSETDEHGARVMLEEGNAHVQVVPRKKSRWVFDAGPCRVQVTGTRFDMHWSPAEQRLEVSLFSGTVTVKGPPATGGVPMRAGQRLVMDVRHGSVRLEDLGALSGGPAPQAASQPAAAQPAVTATPELAPPPAAEPTPASPPPARERTAATGGMRRAGASPSSAWPARVRDGQFRDVVAEAQHRGIDGVLREEPAANIMALADAARYAGNGALARRALTEARGRFPGTPAAYRAAFLLGRMAEDQDGDLRRALDWYGLYLRDATDDSFRAEALGRQMSVTLRLHGAARARPLAEDYLRLYPRGAYGDAARAIMTP